ncbi:MAG TPA: monovalent cation/H+ antiporter subunit D [Steroidobacteraceae bacterium]|nr:monovalent cation/H+ antiporter subunit D [Steroidobacteraceae bacterium]
MNFLLRHMIVLPILIPLLAGAAMLFLSEARRGLRLTLALGSVTGQLLVGCTLLYLTSDAAGFIWPEGVGVYTIGNWAAPFGIVLVVDRLAAVMVTLSAVVSLATMVYAISRWDRPGQPFHSLFQLLTMGLNGAFLTGDLFNLFVFFEVLLAASYGLVLRGVGAPRVKAGMHYIVVNLAASFLFLIGVAMIYGMAGTLNMADLAGRVATLDPQDRALFDAGAAILGIAFLVKAGSWPLNFWLPGAYSLAHAPVAAVFAMMTKVGLYAILRVGTILDVDERLGAALFYIGTATLVTAAIAMLGAKHLARLVAYSVLASMGILLATLGLQVDALTAPVMFYMIVSVLTSCAFFMLTGMTDRTRITDPPADPLDETASQTQPIYVAYGIKEPSVYRDDDDEVGIPIPATMAFLGLMFVCCVLLVTGLPPLPGFVAKFAVLATAVQFTHFTTVGPALWMLCGAVLLSGLTGVIALSRVGMRLFWGTVRITPRLRVLEASPVAVLVMLCLALGIWAGPVADYLDSAARSLHEPDTYIRVVLSQRGGAVAPEEAP